MVIGLTQDLETQNVAALNFLVNTLINDIVNSATPAADFQALDGVASGDRYLQTKDATLTAEANALTTLKANMAVITSAISLGNGYTLTSRK